METAIVSRAMVKTMDAHISTVGASSTKSVPIGTMYGILPNVGNSK